MSLKKRGFASMRPEIQRLIASRGGRTAHERGTAHVFTSVQAKEAGRRGGVRSGQVRRERMRSQRSGAIVM